MKPNKSLALALCFGATTLVGCSGDVLTKVPTDQLSSAIFWQQDKDAILSVNAIYPLLNGWDYLYYDAASDNAWSQKTFQEFYPVGNGTMDAASGAASTRWNNSYRAIRRANELLLNIDRIPKIDATLKARLKGEASFMRAYHYNQLANLFGDVPLVLDTIDIPTASKATRTPKAKVIDQVLADLDFAAGVLPTKYTAAADQGRVTKSSALGMKARAALWDGRWQVAADAAKACMDLGVNTLYPKYEDLFHYAGEKNSEILLADDRMQGQRAHSAFYYFAPRSLQGVSDVVPIRSLVDAYLMKDGLPTSSSPLFDPANPYANRDPRMYGTLLYPGATFLGAVYNSLPNSPTADRVGNDFNATMTGYQFIKYVDGADKANTQNSGIDLIMLRYAEVLLTYVEAKVELNQVDGSVVAAFNLVRKRAGMPEVATVTRDMVRLERRIEFAGEGLRVFDIRRWKIAEQVMPGQQYGIDYVENGVKKTVPADNRHFTAPRDYLWPIPLSEINLNPALGQNAGY